MTEYTHSQMENLRLIEITAWAQEGTRQGRLDSRWNAMFGANTKIQATSNCEFRIVTKYGIYDVKVSKVED